MKAYLALAVAGMAVTGCVPITRDLRNAQTGETATCTNWRPIYGDFYPSPKGSYCRCMSGHLAAGYELVSEPKRSDCDAFSAPRSN
jgi:hypothetical protein